jgi:hypothetical protein
LRRGVVGEARSIRERLIGARRRLLAVQPARLAKPDG